MYFLHAVGFGLATAAVLALAASGATLQAGISNFMNFAFGDFLTSGAYFTYTLHQHGVPFLLAVPVGAAGTALVAFLCGYFVFGPYIRRGSPVIMVVVIAIGISFILQSALIMIFGAANVEFGISNGSTHDVGPFLFTTADIVIICGAACILTALHLILRYTKAGKALRATSNNTDLALACGINTRLINNIIWPVSGFLAGLAGVGLVLEIGSLTPSLGYNDLFLILGSVILGGIGRPLGAVAGALVLGMVFEVSGSYVPGAWNQALAFGLLILVLLARPQGIFAASGKVS